MNLKISAELESELRKYIEQVIKSGQFDSEDAVMKRALELLRSEEASPSPTRPKRRGGQWKGQVVISEEFDELPDDIAESFGAK